MKKQTLVLFCALQTWAAACENASPAKSAAPMKEAGISKAHLDFPVIIFSVEHARVLPDCRVES